MQKKIKPEGPLLITVCGFSGSGKSTLAEALAKALPGAVYIDSDRTRKELFGIPVTQKLPPEAYELAFTEKLVVEINRRTGENLAAGKIVVQSALLITPDLRRQPEDFAKTFGVRFQGLWLEADVKTLADRVSKRRNDASDAGIEFLEQQLRISPGDIGWPVIDASQPPEAVLQRALEIILGQERQR